jgi:hypothetical protein
MFTQSLETVTLEPGKSISYSAIWPTSESASLISPGGYNVFAKIMASNLRSEEVKLGISIEPGGR